MNEKTNINDYSYEELVDLEKKMRLKIEKYNVRIEAIAKQKKIQKRKERLAAKEEAKALKLKNKQSKLIDETFNKELSSTQVLNLKENPSDIPKDEMYKVSIDRNSKQERELADAKNARKSVLKEKDNISVTQEINADPNFDDMNKPKKKFRKRTIAIILITLIMMIGAGSVYGYTYYKDTYRELEDFTSKDLIELENWAVQNGVEIIRNYVHSDTAPEYSIIEQDLPGGKVINRKDVSLEVVISLGPDLTKEVNIDDTTFVGMNFDQIVQWTEDNFIENYFFEFVLDDEIPSEVFVSFYVEDLLTDEELAEYNRSQKYTFLISLGDESAELIDVNVIDFSGMTKGEIELWLVKRRLIPDFNYDFSSEVEKNGVISQDTLPGSTVQAGYKITVTISLGEGIEVPNFTKMTLDEISSFSKNNKVTIRQNLKYSDAVGKNSVISQSVAVGSRVKENDTISIDVSLGKVEIIDFIDSGYQIDDIEAWIRTVNNYGAGLSLSFMEDWNEAAKNSIVAQDKIGFVNNGTVITLTTSKGPAVDIPTFDTWTETQVNDFEDNNQITIAIKKVYNYEDAGQVIDSTQTKVGKHPEGTTMDVSVSLGKVPIPDFTGQTKDYIVSLIDSLNASGANVTLNTAYQNVVGGENGRFMTQSVTAGSYNPGFTLTVTFERTAVEVEDFSGKTKSYVESFCSSNDLQCDHVYTDYNDSIAKDSVISNTRIGEALAWSSSKIITINYSKGPVPSVYILLDGAYEGATFAETRDAIVNDIAQQLFDDGVAPSKPGSLSALQAYIPGLSITEDGTVSEGQINTAASSNPGEYKINASITFKIGN